ncbi:hypothetical protein [Nocardiopsis tropica]|uniref:BrnT family toxin n=1 Tax=Nocardiopsis tropica TaxID=109330 RepID=A0ABU7KRI5_9ACTN|nr:hypothetical protein [Nocardiopsis umidischolae]MEE2051905.1 hypothetical protein [Nocardiopsis umidischolae]
MKIWIHWTEASEAHIARHGVVPQEVEEAIESPYWTFPGREGSTVLLGCTRTGRYLAVIMVESTSEHRSMYIATARGMTPKERRAFKRKCG